jgi:hypothetical protein
LVILSSMLNFSFISFLGCAVRLMPAFLSSVTQQEVASQAHPRVQSQGEGFTGVDGEGGTLTYSCTGENEWSYQEQHMDTKGLKRFRPLARDTLCPLLLYCSGSKSRPP